MIKSPTTYKQAPNLLKTVGGQVKPYGKRFMCLALPMIWELTKDKIVSSFEKEGLEWAYEEFEYECSYPAMEKAAASLKAGNFDALIALGGGKALDTGKGAAYRAGVPIIIVPTSASSDAPCSSAAVVYTPEGAPNGNEQYPSNPVLILVDSQIVAEAPVANLVAGMGDALSTYFEARVHYDYKIPNLYGADVTLSGYAGAEVCHKILMQYGREAKKAAEQHIVNEALERVIEANTYLSCFGFENGGLSVAHGVQDAIAFIPESRFLLHGVGVGFGSLCLLVLENRSQKETDEVFAFCKDVGLPITLAEMNLVEDVERKLREVLAHSMPQGHPAFSLPPGKTAEDVFQAVMKVDEIGRRMLAGS
jgi:glycerol dehydrogenase